MNRKPRNRIPWFMRPCITLALAIVTYLMAALMVVRWAQPTGWWLDVVCALANLWNFTRAIKKWQKDRRTYPILKRLDPAVQEFGRALLLCQTERAEEINEALDRDFALLEKHK